MFPGHPAHRFCRTKSAWTFNLNLCQLPTSILSRRACPTPSSTPGWSAGYALAALHNYLSAVSVRTFLSNRLREQPATSGSRSPLSLTRPSPLRSPTTTWSRAQRRKFMLCPSQTSRGNSQRWRKQPRCCVRSKVGRDLAGGYAWYEGQPPGLGEEFLGTGDASLKSERSARLPICHNPIVSRRSLVG